MVNRARVVVVACLWLMHTATRNVRHARIGRAEVTVFAILADVLTCTSDWVADIVATHIAI